MTIRHERDRRNIKRNKLHILELVSNNARWGAFDWIGLFDERAAIRGYDGGYQRDLAEPLATDDVINGWIERRLLLVSSSLCVECSGKIRPDDLVAARAIHFGYTSAWVDRQQVTALRAVSRVGAQVA